MLLPRTTGAARLRDLILVSLLSLALCISFVSPAEARAAWKQRVDKLVRGHAIGVSITQDGKRLYAHARRKARTPASNEKLLLSMPLLRSLGPNHRIPTRAVIVRRSQHVVPGNLWITSHGDPSLTSGGRYARDLAGFGATRLGVLARAIKDAGIRRIRGSVIGSTAYFERDWWAPGWEQDFPAEEIALPTSLSFNGNRAGGQHISDPERRAARWLSKKLRSIGVKVGQRAKAGRPPLPNKQKVVATIRSKRIVKLVRYMNRNSSNFFAEVFGKRLAVETYSGWGSISKGAAAIERFARRKGVNVQAFDSSGLSYANRVSAAGITRLLRAAGNASWGGELRSSLAGAGDGTLQDRLAGVRLRAKTGTLDGFSALSGWVWLRHSRSWAEFAILSEGMPKYQAADIEDRIVRNVSMNAGPR